MLTCGGGTLPILEFLLVPGLATEDTVISRLVDKSRSSISGLSVLVDLPFLFVDARLRSNISISGLVLLLSLLKSLTSVVGLPYMCLDWEYTDGDWKTLGGSGPIGSRKDLVTGCWCAAGAGAGKMLVCGKSCANALIVLLLWCAGRSSLALESNRFICLKKSAGTSPGTAGRGGLHEGGS